MSALVNAATARLLCLVGRVLEGILNALDPPHWKSNDTWDDEL